MKHFPGHTVEEITELAIDLASQYRNINTGEINKADLVNGAWYQSGAAYEQMQESGDCKVGRYYSLSTVASCAEKIAEQIATTGMVDIG